jgi:hypothetical protein
MARPSSETQYRADDLNWSDRWLDSGSGKNPVIHCPQIQLQGPLDVRRIGITIHGTRKTGCSDTNGTRG